MRFFSGSRDLKSPKGKASEAFKARLNPKFKDMPAESPLETYKKAIDERMARLLEDYLLGKKKNMTKLPGTKQEDDSAPREIPKNTQMILRMLALKREAKERKAQKKRELEFLREKKRKKYAEDQMKLQEELLKKQAEDERMAAEHAAAKAAEAEKSSWW